MSRKIRSDALAASLITTFLVSATFVGCAKDGAANPFAPRFEDPAIAAARKDILEKSPKPTIQQASFESRVPDPKWHDSLTSAISEAKTNNKLILADFTGSDWCHYCVKLKDEVFSTPEFKAWASDNVALLEIDFPKRTQLPPEIQRQNEMLKSRYQISSYPTVLLLDTEGNVQAKLGYENGKSAAQWVQLAESRLVQNASRTESVASRPNGQSIR